MSEAIRALKERGDIDPCPALSIPDEELGASGITERVGLMGERLFYIATPGVDPELPCVNCPIQMCKELLEAGLLKVGDIKDIACSEGEPHTVTIQVVEEGFQIARRD